MDIYFVFIFSLVTLAMGAGIFYWGYITGLNRPVVKKVRKPKENNELEVIDIG